MCATAERTLKFIRKRRAGGLVEDSPETDFPVLFSLRVVRRAVPKMERPIWPVVPSTSKHSKTTLLST
jgi:hypothetical protein